MLVRLVYVSTLVAGVTSSDIDEIVRSSRSANEGAAVTGMLALEGDRVCQILEGEDVVVDALYEKIGHDPRHGDVMLLDRQVIDATHFGDWGMRRSRMVDVVMLAFSL